MRVLAAVQRERAWTHRDATGEERGSAGAGQRRALSGAFGQPGRHACRTARYKLRQQTVEPVFGIIKEALGFRRFSLRGLEKAALEWTLVTLAYNCKRLFYLGVKLATA